MLKNRHDFLMNVMQAILDVICQVESGVPLGYIYNAIQSAVTFGEFSVLIATLKATGKIKIKFNQAFPVA